MKKYILALIVSSLVLSACGNTPQPTANGTPSTPPEKKTEEATLVKSLKDLITSGTAQKCTWQSSEGNSTITGDVLISGKKFKQIATIANKDTKTVTTAVSDGTTFYSWSDASAMGIKMNLAEAEKNKTAEGQKGNESMDWSKENNYKCAPAVVSEADFAVPTNIQFTDLSEMQKALQGIDIEKMKKQFGQE